MSSASHRRAPPHNTRTRARTHARATHTCTHMHTHTHAHPHAHAHHSHTPPLRAHRPSMRPRPCLPPVSHGGAPPSCSARRGPHPFPSAFGAAGRRRCGRPPARLSAAARGLARGLPAHGLHLSRVCARDAPPLVHYGAGRDHHRPPRRAIAPASPSADPPPKSHRFLCSPQGPSRTSSRCSRRAAGARAAAVASPRWTRAPGRSAPPTRSGCSWCAHMFVLRAVWGGQGPEGAVSFSCHLLVCLNVRLGPGPAARHTAI